MQVRPHLMLQGAAREAIDHWRAAFSGLLVEELGENLWRLSLGGLEWTVFDSPPVHDFGPTPSWSLMVEVDASDDVDRLAAALAAKTMMPAGAYDFAERFAWVEDRFGVSWQLIHRPM